MADSAAPLTLAVFETLDSIVAPAIRDAIIASALKAENRASLPHDLGELCRFLLGPLRASLVATVGRELGDSITEELHRAVNPPQSSRPSHPPPSPRAKTWPEATRRRTGPTGYRTTPPDELGSSAVAADRTPLGSREQRPDLTQPSADLQRRSAPVTGGGAQGSNPAQRLARIRTAPSEQDGEPYRARLSSHPSSDSSMVAAPPSSSLYPRGTAQALGVRGADASRRLPFVLVATMEPQLVKQLAGWLDPRAAVIRVRGAFALMHDLENANGAPTVIIVDCKSPSVRPAALAGLADELPSYVHVVLWGAPPELERQVVAISDRARGWFVCAAHAQPKDVAERCAELVR